MATRKPTTKKPAKAMLNEDDMTEHKTFYGKTYNLASFHKTKEDAEKTAKFYKSLGQSTKIIQFKWKNPKNGGVQYVIYRRQSKGSNLTR
jgi:hypothetical protein